MRVGMIWLFGGLAGLSAGPLEYAAAPVDNPLKGMVPYVSESGVDRFPHSMEFRYFFLNDLMKARACFDWRAVEETLKITQERGCQLVMRVVVEYPGKGNLVPPFLIDEGVEVVRWDNDGKTSFSPNYSDPRIRSAMKEFIMAFGKKYDGDHRIGFVTAGVLGSWGEWHTYPRNDLWADKKVQTEVLDAFQKAFTETPVLLRYPSKGEGSQAGNVGLGFGYHDDSFCWATLETGNGGDDWFFMPSMRNAGALDAWKTCPIGGELRPELWETSFSGSPHQRDQGFLKCVEATHVSWLMDSGLFGQRYPLSDERRQRALREVRRMGYAYFASSWKYGDDGKLEVTVENRGVAPFYMDWPVELEVTRGGGVEVTRHPGMTQGILPMEAKVWQFEPGDRAEGLRLRVPNPMPGGKALRFANKEQVGDWLVLMN